MFLTWVSDEGRGSWVSGYKAGGGGGVGGGFFPKRAAPYARPWILQTSPRYVIISFFKKVNRTMSHSWYKVKSMVLSLWDFTLGPFKTRPSISLKVERATWLISSQFLDVRIVRGRCGPCRLYRENMTALLSWKSKLKCRGIIVGWNMIIISIHKL